MAKGFTVKASKPKKNKQEKIEWDYENIKERCKYIIQKKFLRYVKNFLRYFS